MNLCSVSVTALLASFVFLSKLIHGSYIGDIAVNCGYHGNTTALDGRQWFGDTDSSSDDVSMLQPKGHSKSSIPLQKSLPADPIPYMTARASATQFYYSFALNPGQKFIRLHFYPSSSYRGFEKSLDYFTVRAGPFTLLRNFSASLAADSKGVNYVIKEFCLTLEEKVLLNLTFTATQSVKGKKSFYAYVNGIEIITMPTGLYFTPDGDLGALIVGQSNRYFHIDNSTALETVQRLNIGGSSISPVEDFGMFRRWDEDSNYLMGLGSKPQPVNHLMLGTNTGVYTFTAPPRIYHTSWQTDKNGRTWNAYYNFTWKIPVDLGFGYLVRLHFCDFALVEREGNNGMEIIVLIDNTLADVIMFSARNGVPIYKDYMVMVKGDEVDKYDLFVALQSSHELAIELLRGLEIFKLSNLDNNLASKNEVYLKQVLVASFNQKTKYFLSPFDRKNTIATGITVLLILLNLIVSKLRQNRDGSFHEEKDSQLDSEKQSCRKFSLAEILLATQNFSNALLIGKGGFGYVYKGFIRGDSEIIAVKRLKSNSRQGAREFWTEIETLSNIRHKHLVSLIGYCNDYREMILVYEYMPCGTLADNLYGIGKIGEDGTCLTWEQRLSICIGAARGIGYLHTGTKQEIIHRDVKDSNILLDKNLVAKISDFGLSKLGKVSESQSLLSTKVRGTPGFVDPDYFMTHKPTTKTDVYAFGVVMLVVLCGRPAIDRSIPWEPRSLLSLFQEYMRKGDVNDIVDPSMQGKISKQSLNEFIKSLESCLHIEPRDRPTMSELATSLEYALEMQQTTIAFNSEGPTATSGQYSDDEMPILSPVREEFTSSSIPMERITATEEVVKDVQPQRGETKRALFKKTFIASAMEALWKKRKTSRKQDSSLELSEYAHFSEIQAATNNFSIDHKIGEGGSGQVYKGTLPNGKDIAVKRLSRTSVQGVGEFKNEISLVSKLQHRNLVCLLGFSFHGEEKLLIYEFVPNKSLDYFLFDGERKSILDWSTRQKIIVGIAKGLLYLHEDSRLRIIHRDLKASNILLDENMNPKIADFGLAKIFDVDQSEVETSRIAGTYGYMAPEYLVYGQFSVKSDVYSFGVLVLEIISGKKNSNRLHLGEGSLLSYAWKNWRNGTPLDLVDDQLGGSNYSTNEILQCIHVGLLCVQEDVELRPTMASVVLMLSSTSITLAAPRHPAFFAESGTESFSPRMDLEESDKSTTTKSVPASVNETSSTELYPR